MKIGKKMIESDKDKSTNPDPYFTIEELMEGYDYKNTEELIDWGEAVGMEIIENNG